MADDPMWCLVMFDLPVKTVVQRRQATQFRNHLLDLGFCRVQYSIYVRYNPTPSGDAARVKELLNYVPANGEARILYVSDRQWANMIRFCNQVEEKPEDQPEQLAFF